MSDTEKGFPAPVCFCSEHPSKPCPLEDPEQVAALEQSVAQDGAIQNTVQNAQLVQVTSDLQRILGILESKNNVVEENNRLLKAILRGRGDR